MNLTYSTSLIRSISVYHSYMYQCHVTGKIPIKVSSDDSKYWEENTETTVIPAHIAHSLSIVGEFGETYF